jgi:hypothetical protein
VKGHGRIGTTTGRSGERVPAGTSRTTEGQVWSELGRASFAILSFVTPTGEPRSSGVVYAVETRHMYCAVAPWSWKARQISDGQEVAVTVPVRRGGLLSLVAPIPPATVSFRARTIVHPPGSLDIGSLSKRLQSLLPKDRREATVLELIPEGTFLTYGIGVSLREMLNPAVAQAHVPITSRGVAIESELADDAAESTGRRDDESRPKPSG